MPRVTFTRYLWFLAVGTGAQMEVAGTLMTCQWEMDIIHVKIALFKLT